MRRYIVLLLITGIVWAQTDFDKLVLKDGTTYLGEYSKTEGDRVYFRHQDALAFQPVPVKLIQTLKLKDGHFIIGAKYPEINIGIVFTSCVIITVVIILMFIKEIMDPSNWKITDSN